MSLDNETVRQVYTGNGVATEFAITQAIEDKDQLFVYQITVADGSVVPLALGVDYDLLPNELNPESVEITPALSSDYQVLILRVTPNTQIADFENMESFNATSFEEIMNWIVMQTQELKDLSDRSVKLKDSVTNSFDTSIPLGGTAGQVLALNATLDGFEWVDKD